MNCPSCKSPTVYSEESSTLVSYQSPNGHNHDDNCLKRYYACMCGRSWVESVRRQCDIPGCGWQGKRTCFCHPDEPKVEQWTDKTMAAHH